MDFEDTTPEIMIYKPPHPPTNESKKKCFIWSGLDSTPISSPALWEFNDERERVFSGRGGL